MPKCEHKDCSRPAITSSYSVAMGRDVFHCAEHSPDAPGPARMRNKDVPKPGTDPYKGLRWDIQDPVPTKTG